MSDLTEFKVTRETANTCSACGQGLKVGDAVFAPHWDAVRAGAGVCATCAKPKPAQKPARKSKGTAGEGETEG